MSEANQTALFDLCLRLGDDRLILGHRISEWCGHAPILEEDIAMANIALDLIGQANNFLKLAGEVEGKGRSEDNLAFLRDAIDYKNLQLVEQPNGDFGKTIVRQFLFDAWSVPLMERLQTSSNTSLAGIAAKAYKEDLYHLRHSQTWVIRLGDGTEESNRRVQDGFNELWRYVPEMFEIDSTLKSLESQKIIPNLADIKPIWEATVKATIKEAKLTEPPGVKVGAYGSRQGRHTEALGRILAEMQFLQRSYPGATW